METWNVLILTLKHNETCLTQAPASCNQILLSLWIKTAELTCFNPLLHGLFLDYDIIFFFLNNIEKKSRKK